jgi:hypothetical protein
MLLILSVFIISSCTTGQKSLQQGNFYDALMKAVNRLGSDPDNRKASQVVREGYPMAMAYYQEEIDKMLTGNDPFKWNQTLDVMNTVNQISDEIRRIPAARQLVTSPKTYTSELINVQNHAAQEHYDAGMDLLARNTRETAKEAFYHFRSADALVHGFKDVAAKMQKAKEMATLTVVVEQIPVNGKYEYSAQFFYDNVFQMLNQKFQEKDFVHFFSPEEAERVKLKYPDMVLRMGFYDFFIDRPQHFEEEKDLTKQIEEKYEVKVSRDSTVTKTRLVTKKGKIRIVTDQVASGGLLEIKCVDFQSQKIIFTDKVPGQFTWQNQYGVFVGEKEVLDNNLANIISNKVQMPPASQDMFVLFTKPIFNQLTSKLVNYFSQYN